MRKNCVLKSSDLSEGSTLLTESQRNQSKQTQAAGVYEIFVCLAWMVARQKNTRFSPANVAMKNEINDRRRCLLRFVCSCNF